MSGRGYAEQPAVRRCASDLDARHITGNARVMLVRLAHGVPGSTGNAAHEPQGQEFVSTAVVLAGSLRAAGGPRVEVVRTSIVARSTCAPLR